MGLSFAQALVNHPYFREAGPKKIAVVDLQEPPSLARFSGEAGAEPPEQRTSTLTPSSLRFLRDIGGLEHVNSERCRPYHRVCVWERDGSGFLSFEHEDQREMGRTIENSHLVAALYQSLKESVASGDCRVESSSSSTTKSSSSTSSTTAARCC